MTTNDPPNAAEGTSSPPLSPQECPVCNGNTDDCPECCGTGAAPRPTGAELAAEEIVDEVYNRIGEGKRDLTAKEVAAIIARHCPNSGDAGRWLPIESAPKDGTRILAASEKEYRPWIALWHEGRWLVCDHPARRTPSHWQPLPQPPPALERDGG